MIFEKEWKEILSAYLQRSDYTFNPVNYTVKSLEPISFDTMQQKAKLEVQFHDPNVLGLNEDKSDRLFVGLNTSYPLQNLFLNSTRRELYSYSDFQSN